MNLSLNINEIFSSLQGEGKYTGYPTTFIRLNKCNLNCIYCDTDNSKKNTKMLIDKICGYVYSMRNQHICITGGEPLLQDGVYILIYDLVGAGYNVTIETNGSVLIPRDEYRRSFSYCMDVKCPSSGESSSNALENLEVLQSHDEVKFVLRDLLDYNYAKDILKKYPTKASIIFSPMFEDSGEYNSEWLVETLQDDKLQGVRLGVQLHKILSFK